MKLILILLTVILFNFESQGAIRCDETPVVRGFHSVYAPTVLTINGIKHMWSGGWLTPEDQLNASDKLFHSVIYSNGSASYPSPIKWNNPGFDPGKIPNYHANDPSVVSMGGSHLIMYFTLLHDRYSYDEEEMVKRNLVGYATSSNNGLTWTYRGILIGQNNGYNSKGAWAPSALKRGSETWLYFHQNYSLGTPNGVLRQRFSSRIGRMGTPKKVKFVKMGKKCTASTSYCIACRQFNSCDPKYMVDTWVEDTDGIDLINVDVMFDGTWYVLVGNKGLNEVYRYISSDGLTFLTHPKDVNPIMSLKHNQLLTPHQEHIHWDKYNIYFGLAHYTPGGYLAESMHYWTHSSYGNCF